MIYLVLLCCLGLGIMTYLFYDESQRVEELTSHKNLLIDKLAEKTLAHRQLEREHDSLMRYFEQPRINPDTNQLSAIRTAAKKKL